MEVKKEEVGVSNLIIQQAISRVFIVNISEDITQELLNGVIEELHRAVPNEMDRLEIQINSYGGDYDATLGFINSILTLFGGNITTFLTGVAYSAAAMLFMAGSRRFIYEESSLMLHTYSQYSQGKISDQMADAKHNHTRFIRVMKKFFGHFLEDADMQRIIDGRDVYFDSQEMLDTGLATDIISISFNYSADDDGGSDENV